jgi:glycosyltransferase involved in cell wall biosynthesis
MNRTVVFMGFNDPKRHKRGVENVISIQMGGLPRKVRKIYIYFDDRSSVSRWEHAISIGLKKGPLRFIMLNLLVWALRARFGRGGRNQLLLHSHNYLMSAFLWWRTDVFSVHDGLWRLKLAFGTRVPWAYWIIEKWVYARSRCLHCNSSYTYGSSLLAKSAKTAEVIYCSTPLELYRTPAELQPLRLVNSDETLVLSVRSIEPRARVDLILEVAELAALRGHRLHFVVAGKGPLLSSFKDEIARKGICNVTLTGYVSDLQLARMYAGCDVVLTLCEYGEGFGIPVIEGYLLGKRVIASDRCAIPEIVASRDDLVENDAEAILGKLLEASEHPIDGGDLRHYYESRFSNEIISRLFSDLYRNAFGAKDR